MKVQRENVLISQFMIQKIEVERIQTSKSYNLIRLQTNKTYFLHFKHSYFVIFLKISSKPFQTSLVQDPIVGYTKQILKYLLFELKI